jgi:hypothetical protein
MFAYNPQVTDRSGEFIAQGMSNAAQINSQSMQQMGQDIGGAISSLGAMYAQNKMQAAGGKAFKDFMGMAGPSMGIKDEQLKLFKSMNDSDAYQMSQMFMPIAPSMISATGLGNYNNRLALANQQAANQAAARQPAANQVPLGAQAPAATANPETLPAPAFIDPSVKTRSLLKR